MGKEALNTGLIKVNTDIEAYTKALISPMEEFGLRKFAGILRTHGGYKDPSPRIEELHRERRATYISIPHEYLRAFAGADIMTLIRPGVAEVDILRKKDGSWIASVRPRNARDCNFMTVNAEGEAFFYENNSLEPEEIAKLLFRVSKEKYPQIDSNSSNVIFPSESPILLSPPTS